MPKNITDLQPQVYPVLPVRGIVIFPENTIHFDVGRKRSMQAIEFAMKHDRRVFITCQRNARQNMPKAEDLYDIGVVAEIQQLVSVQSDRVRIGVEGIYRAKANEFYVKDPFYSAVVTERPLTGLKSAPNDRMDAAMRAIKDLYEDYCLLSPKMPDDLLMNAQYTQDPVYLVEYIAANTMMRPEMKQQILEEDNVLKRLKLLATMLKSENEILEIEKEIYDQVREQMDRNQREHYQIGRAHV